MPVCDIFTRTHSLLFVQQQLFVAPPAQVQQRQRYMFYFARVNWYSVHPERFSHGVPVEIWCNSFDLFGPACFMPVQRIKSNCSLGEKVYKQENVLGVTS